MGQAAWEPGPCESHEGAGRSTRWNDLSRNGRVPVPLNGVARNIPLCSK